MPGGSSKVICGSCNGTVAKNGSIQCRICSSWIHASCANLTEKDLSAIKAIKAFTFICSSCITKLDNGEVCQTAVGEPCCGFNEKFDRFLVEYKDESKSIKAALVDITSKLSSLSEMKTDILDCKKRIEVLSSSNAELKAEINVLHRRLNRADIIIGGLPENLDNLEAVVLALGDVYKIKLSTHDIFQVCYMHNRKHVLVKFNSVKIRDKIMSEYFKTRSLKIRYIINGEGNDIDMRIYLNDHHSPAASNSICRQLLRKKLVTKFKILNSDNLRVKLLLPDGKEIVRNFHQCTLLLNNGAAVVNG